jgi:ribosome-associated protein
MTVTGDGPVVPETDYTLVFVRSAGPGGQNVNKLATAAQLRFHLGQSRLLDDAAKERLRVLAGRRLTDDDDVLIIARNHRTQEGNRREALARLTEMIATAQVRPRVRHKTRPTKASKERRLAEKARGQQVKKLRGRPRGDD